MRSIGHHLDHLGEHRLVLMLFLLEHPLGSRPTHRTSQHTSGHQLPRCWQQFHRHSDMEAFRNEVDPAQELELVLAVALAELALAVVWELEEMVGLVWALEEEEDPQKASHTCHPCTSFPFRTADQGCTSSHTGGKECRTEHALPLFLLGNRLGTQHQKSHIWLHK